MKILFLVYHGFSDVSGISKKIHYQVKGLWQNGHEVHLCYYDRGENGHWQRLISVENGRTSTLHVIEDYGTGRMAGMRQRTSYGALRDYCVLNGIQMVYARCFQNANPWLVRFFRDLKEAGIKSVMEIPTYPYDQEFQGFSRIERLQLRIDQLYRRKLARQLEAIVTFTSEQLIFGQRTINISNGVDFDSMPLHQRVDTSRELHLIGVAEVHFWHGYDRLIAGLGEYYRTASAAPRKPVYFHIVGGVWKTEMHNSEHAPGFAELIEKYGLQDKVIFHDQLFGDALNAVFDQSSFAIGSLARHRSGISDIKTLKNREYASRVDVARIVAFEEQLRMSPLEIRQTVEHLSWKVQMAKVVSEVQSEC